MLEESISTYKDDAGRCSEACPAHVALRAACIRCGKVAQRNHWDYFILPRCTTLLSFQKTTLFLPQRRCKSRTETSDITRATSHKKPSHAYSIRFAVSMWTRLKEHYLPHSNILQQGTNTTRICQQRDDRATKCCLLRADRFDLHQLLFIHLVYSFYRTKHEWSESVEHLHQYMINSECVQYEHTQHTEMTFQNRSFFILNTTVWLWAWHDVFSSSQTFTVPI